MSKLADYQREGIIQVITRTPEYQIPGEGNGVRVRQKDEIWGLSNYGRLFQMTPEGWQLRLGALNE